MLCLGLAEIDERVEELKLIWLERDCWSLEIEWVEDSLLRVEVGRSWV